MTTHTRAKLGVRRVGSTASGGVQYEVTGGDAPHTVLVELSGPYCDCPAYHYGTRPCKHIQAVELAQTPDDHPPASAAGNGRPTEGRRARFDLLGIDALLALKAPGWWIDGVLPLGGLAVLYSPPGSGKSFLALAWAIALAADQPWLGRRTLWSPAAYVAAEGAHGLGIRLRALLDAHAIEQQTLVDRFAVVPETVNLMDAGAVTDLVTDCRTYFGCNPGLVVVDTLSRAMPGGDENSVKDVSTAIAGADAIRRATNACVLLVHHTQKAGELERGSSALRGAADTMLALRQEGDRLILECTKQRNAAPIAPLQMRLVPMGESCIVEPYEGAAAGPMLTSNERQALVALSEVELVDGASSGEWQAATKLVGGSYYRARKRLVDLGYVQWKGKQKRYSLTGLGLASALPTTTPLP